MVEIFVKTLRGLEKIAATKIEEIIPNCKAIPRPYGYLGIVLVKNLPIEKEKALELILRNVEEVEKAFVVDAEVKASLNEMAKVAAQIAKEKIDSSETFAVRTTRRGTHNFTSIDVNIVVGDAVRKATNAEVDLNFPHKIVWVEIIHDKAYISITDSRVEHHKMYIGKPVILPILHKITVAQVPYTGPKEAIKKVGVRIGRSVQTFEIKELYVTPFYKVKAEELSTFIEGIIEGINSRYEIQRRTYHRRVRKVEVYVQDLYQFVRDRRGEYIITTSTRGKSILELKDEILRIFSGKKNINILIGAREGLPTGIFRYSTIIVDVAPSITISTDFAFTSIITAFITALELWNALPKFEGRKKSK